MTHPAPRSRRENRRQGELAQRRADAIAGASAVFAAKGYYEAQMTEIAAAAELSRASLYAMFRGKEELYQEVISSTAKKIQEAVRKQVETQEDPRDRLLCVIDSLFSCYEANQDLLRIYTRSTSGLPFKIREAMGEESLEIFRAFTGWVARMTREAKRAGYLHGLDPDAVSLSLVGAINTTAASWIDTAPERPLSKAAAPLRALFERLLERGASA